MSCSAMGAAAVGLGFCGGLIYLFKLVLGITFIVAGSVCLDNGKCSISEGVGAGFVGAGIGLAFGTVVSLLGFVVSESSPNKKSKFGIFVGVKLVIALILLIAGLAVLHEERMSGGLIGTSIGLFFGSIISVGLFYDKCCN